MSLKDKKKYFEYCLPVREFEEQETATMQYFDVEDVKEAVLDFYDHIDMLKLEGEREYLLKQYKNIFGDFEK